MHGSGSRGQEFQQSQKESPLGPGYIIVVEAKENDEKEREKEPNQEEERMRAEETRKYLEKINQEDWFR